MSKQPTIGVLAFGAAAMLARLSAAQVIDAYYAADYTYTDLGSIPDVPSQYGGLCTLLGDSNVLLIGGSANTAAGAIHSVRLVRDANRHIIGFDGGATVFCEAAYNDGGLNYGPDGVLFASRWPVNQLGQIRPGSVVTDKVIDLTPWGVEGSNASLNFIPPGFPGAGRMKIASWSGGQWGELSLAPDGLGTFDVTAFTEVPSSRLPGGPEGFAYVPIDSPLFPAPSMILSEYSVGQVSVFELDAQGDPIIASRRLFMSGLFGAEGAFIDRPTGDFVFSTFGGGSRVIVVRGFSVPPPICPTCAADFNEDGGIDGSDVAAFFDAWERGESCGDVNLDGGIDGTDVGAFFEVWESGGC